MSLPQASATVVNGPPREKAGVVLAGLYIALQPLMLQNPLSPTLPGYLGKAQLVDALAPLMVLWLLWSIVRAGKERRFNMISCHRATLALAVAFIVVCALAAFVNTGTVPVGPIAKYGYLLLILLFFVVLLEQPGVAVPMFRISVWVSLFYLGLTLVFVLVALVEGEPNKFIHFRTDFPYLGNVVRVIGPMEPTAKTYGAFLLFMALLLFIGKDYLGRGVWAISLAGIVICSALAFSRVGLATAVFVLLAWAAHSRHRAVWLSFMAFPALGLLVLVQVVTIWHFDAAALNSGCGEPYSTERQTQYFGWYEKPELCYAVLRSNITYSSYFLLKLIAWQGWMSSPWLGLGPDQFGDLWLAAAGDRIPIYYKDHHFPTAQSTFLTLLVETGLLGLVVWLGLMFVLARRIWRIHARPGAGFWTLLVWLVCTLYAMIDLEIQNFRFVYYLLPLATFLPSTAGEERGATP